MYQTVTVVFFVQDAEQFDRKLTQFLEVESLSVLDWQEPKEATDSEISLAAELGIIYEEESV